MRLTKLRLENFRNHGDTHLQCADGMNVFLGDNGGGKTNILEAISYLCLTKSFYAGNDRFALRRGKEFFVLEGEFWSDNGVELIARVLYNSSNAEKKFWVHKAEVETLTSVIGRFPIVILSPEGNAITQGSHAYRRKFVDLVVSQASRVYFENLLEYRRALKQRNKILFEAKITRQDCSDIIEPWDRSLIERGAQIILRRQSFLREFTEYVADAFQQLTGGLEIPSMGYGSSVPLEGSNTTVEQVQMKFEEQLQRQREEERRTGITLVGPHRDEIEFAINGLELRKFASQGQHKTFLVALKVAEFFYLKKRCNESPILLLDDIFSELDEQRTQRVLGFVQNLGQTFITSTSEQMFPSNFEWGGSAKKFYVRQGAVIHEETSNLLH